MLTYCLFIIGFMVLIKGAGFLIDGSSALAKRWGISDLVIGLTIVAFGTSAPELIVNIIASLKETSNLVFGNIIGSNISNILLILGITSLVYPLSIKHGTVWKEIPISFLALLALFFLANSSWAIIGEVSGLSRIDGIILIFLFALFIGYAFFISRIHGEEKIDVKKYPLLSSFMMIITGSIGLFLGGRWIVEGAIAISQNLGISEALIGITVVAIGTSLPELAACLIAALKKSADIAIGNIIGSNVFNILWVLGLTSIIHPLSFDKALNPDLILLGLATLLLFFFLVYGKKSFFEFLKGKTYTLARWEGTIFVIIYGLYIISAIIRR